MLAASFCVLCSDAGYANCAAAAQASAADAFIDDPRQLLQTYPRGGLALEMASQSFLVSGAKARRSLGALIAIANATQKASIATAFASVYSSCRDKDPGIARDIDDIVRSSSHQDFRRAFFAYLADDHPAPDLKANIEDSTPQNKLGFNKLASPEFRDPKKPIPLPGAKWFD